VATAAIWNFASPANAWRLAQDNSAVPRKMILNAVMRTAKAKLRPGERKIFGGPGLALLARSKFVAQIETFGLANGGRG
jgi:hypothetical protein